MGASRAKKQRILKQQYKAAKKAHLRCPKDRSLKKAYKDAKKVYVATSQITSQHSSHEKEQEYYEYYDKQEDYEYYPDNDNDHSDDVACIFLCVFVVVVGGFIMFSMLMVGSRGRFYNDEMLRGKGRTRFEAKVQVNMKDDQIVWVGVGEEIEISGSSLPNNTKVRRRPPLVSKCDNGKCKVVKRGNGVCDAKCNNADCNYDNGDCFTSSAIIGPDRPSPLHSNANKIQLRHQEFEYCANNRAKNVPLLTLFTTLHPSKDPLKVLAQQNTLQSYANLAPLVRGIVFTNSQHWIKQAKRLNITVVHIDHKMKNRHGTPFFHSMFQEAYNFLPATYFYGYANGDILFSKDLITTLCSIKQAIKHQIIKERFLLTGRRLNHDLALGPHHLITSNMQEQDATVLKWAKQAEVFIANAQDYFFVTKKTFHWDVIPPYVIGRLGYDNCLVHQMNANRAVDTIDGSLSVHAVHQTVQDGNRAGHKRFRDKNWNLRRCRRNYKGARGWKWGSNDHCEYYTSWHENKLVLKLRSNSHNVPPLPPV